MRVNQGDRVNYRHICVLRKRELMTFDSTNWWSVVASLINGSEFAFATDCTKKEAEEMVVVIRKACDQIGLPMVKGDSDAHINLDHISQMFIDEEGSNHAVFLEDANATNWLFSYGNEDECKEIIVKLGKMVSREEQQDGFRLS
jgi:hypothetical protein